MGPGLGGLCVGLLVYGLGAAQEPQRRRAPSRPSALASAPGWKLAPRGLPFVFRRIRPSSTAAMTGSSHLPTAFPFL